VAPEAPAAQPEAPVWPPQAPVYQPPAQPAPMRPTLVPPPSAQPEAPIWPPQASAAPAQPWNAAAAVPATRSVWEESSLGVVNRPGSCVQACVSCGLPLSAAARFCRRCGSRQG
jgi:hypothetical protein